MKIDRGTDEVFDDRTARFDHGDPADRARLANFEAPPTPAEQLAMLADLVDDADLDQHDDDDLRQALRLVEVYREQIGAWLDREATPDKLRERVSALSDQLLIAATQLGAAHQRIFDRPPLAAIVERRRKGGAAAARSKARRNDAFERENLPNWEARLRGLYQAGHRDHNKASGIISDEMQAETGDKRHSQDRIYNATSKAWKALKQGRNT